MASGLSRWLSDVRDLFYPPKCVACRKLLPWRIPSPRPRAEVALCAHCLSLWERETEADCGVCGRAVRECLCMPPLIKEARCYAFCKSVYYLPRENTPVQNRLIYHIKKNNDHRAFRFLAAQWVSGLSVLLSDAGVDAEDCVVTYVPRSRHSYLEEGVDQSKELARCLGDLLSVECKALILRAPDSNTKQKALTPAERLENAQKAFLPLSRDRICRGKTVLLVDDVMTTGASMARCVRLLRKMGAARVFCVCVATDHVNRDGCVRAEG